MVAAGGRQTQERAGRGPFSGVNDYRQNKKTALKLGAEKSFAAVVDGYEPPETGSPLGLTGLKFVPDS